MTGFCRRSIDSYISSVGSTPAYSSVSSMPSLRPPMQKNLSPAPVITSTRVRVSRRTSLMQSRISWHICGVNMLPSSGRFSVSEPTGPSSWYRIVSKLNAYPLYTGSDDNKPTSGAAREDEAHDARRARRAERLLQTGSGRTHLGFVVSFQKHERRGQPVGRRTHLRFGIGHPRRLLVRQRKPQPEGARLRHQ